MSDLKTKTKVKTAFKNYSLDIIKILNITTRIVSVSLSFKIKDSFFIYIYMCWRPSFCFLMKVNILRHYLAAEY